MSTHPTERKFREQSDPGPTSTSEPPAAADVTADPAPEDPAGPEGESPGAGDGRIGVSGTQVAASVLASVSAAVVASFFGVAGTIVGTAVVSVVATVGSAAYGLGIRRTKQRLQKLQALKQVQAMRITRPLPRRDGAGPSAAADLTVADEAGWRAWLSQRRWGLAAGVALVFVISMAAVTVIELVGDGPLAGQTGGARGTSLGALLPGGDTDDEGDGDRSVTVTTDPTDGSPTTTAADEGVEADPQATTTTTPGRATTTTTAPGTSTTTAPTTTTTAPDAGSPPPTTAPGPTTPPTTGAPPPPG